MLKKLTHLFEQSLLCQRDTGRSCKHFLKHFHSKLYLVYFPLPPSVWRPGYQWLIQELKIMFDRFSDNALQAEHSLLTDPQIVS